MPRTRRAPPRQPLRLAEVAQMAGVSTATVSRVLNRPDSVRPDTRAAVLRAVEELGYTPNLHARTLAEGDSRTIGVIVSNLENPFFLDVFRGLETEARRLGYEVLVANTDYDPDRLATSVQLMIGRRVSGVAAIVSEIAPSLVTEFTRRRVPLVLYDAGIATKQAVHIRVDYTSVMRELMEMLYGLGHRRFAFVGHHTSLDPLNARLQAFLEVANRHPRTVRYATVANADSLEGGRGAARELLESSELPTAIVCVNDMMAAGVLRELRDRGIDVPRQVSVTGFDNIALAEYVTPALTTVDIPRAEIGRLAVAGLIPGPRGARGARGTRLKTREVVLTPRLVVRSSTARAPGK